MVRWRCWQVKIAECTTPWGKLQCLKKSLALLSQWLVSGVACWLWSNRFWGTSSPVNAAFLQGSTKFTADDLLPSLMAVIVRCPVEHLCAHFSYIQFHNDASSELQYHLTTVRAALQYIRRAGDSQPLLHGLAEASFCG